MQICCTKLWSNPKHPQYFYPGFFFFVIWPSQHVQSPIGHYSTCQTRFLRLSFVQRFLKILLFYQALNIIVMNLMVAFTDMDWRPTPPFWQMTKLDLCMYPRCNIIYHQMSRISKIEIYSFVFSPLVTLWLTCRLLLNFDLFVALLRWLRNSVRLTMYREAQRWMQSE